MGYNIFVQKEKGAYCVVFPKCGWTLFYAHCNSKEPRFRLLTNNNFPVSKVNIDAFFIRNPIDRIISGFKNKYLDNPDKDIYTRDWLIKILNLKSKEEIPKVSFDQFLDKLEELVNKAKQDKKTEFFNSSRTYFDVHFCPFYLQLKQFPQKQKKFLDIRKDLDYLEYLGIDYNIIKNSSGHVPFQATTEQKERIEEIYKEDMIIYENYEKNRINIPSIQELN